MRGREYVIQRKESRDKSGEHLLFIHSYLLVMGAAAQKMVLFLRMMTTMIGNDELNGGDDDDFCADVLMMWKMRMKEFFDDLLRDERMPLMVRML